MTATAPEELLDPLAHDCPDDGHPPDEEEGAHWTCCDPCLALCGKELEEHDPWIDADVEDTDCKACVYLLQFPTMCCGEVKRP